MEGRGRVIMVVQEEMVVREEVVGEQGMRAGVGAGVGQEGRHRDRVWGWG